MNPGLEGMHDIYYGTRLPPHRLPIPLVEPGDRIGEQYFRCDPGKVIAVVETHASDRNSKFSPPDENSNRIAGHILEFLAYEVKKGRMPAELLPHERQQLVAELVLLSRVLGLAADLEGIFNDAYVHAELVPCVHGPLPFARGAHQP